MLFRYENFQVSQDKINVTVLITDKWNYLVFLCIFLLYLSSIIRNGAIFILTVTLLQSERSKLHRVLAVLRAVGLKNFSYPK